MGGGAFAGLYTPRMPPAIYKHVCHSTLQIIRKHYAQAECPIEAPAKADYGDIDILVEAGRAMANGDEEQVNMVLAAELSAVSHKTTSNSQTTNFAIPWPEADGQTSSEKFIQLDLHRCPSVEGFAWELFQTAHGDLWNILGGMIRPYGLVVNNTGLYVRIDGAENISKELSKVKLTNSPAEVLRFMGLDEDRYWKPFDSVDDMFAYAATCRFHDPKRYKDREDLKSNDRQRSKKRPVFARWLEEFLPAHREDMPGERANASRSEVIEDAKKVFGTGEEYENRRAEVLRTIGLEKLWSGLRQSLPLEGLSLGLVTRGVKREVIGSASGLEVGEMNEIQKAYAEGRFDVVTEWANAEWASIAQRQGFFEREKSSQQLRDKIEETGLLWRRRRRKRSHELRRSSTARNRRCSEQEDREG